MTTYVALLRGINVGGHHKLPMADLRMLLADLGFPHARTYIQSGNVVFDADEEAVALQGSIAAAIERAFRFAVPVIVRSRSDLDAMIEAFPFAGRDLDISKVGVTFLRTRPPAGVTFRVPEGLPEEAVVAGREVYVYYPDGMGRTKLERSSFWKPLEGIDGTTRNWRTVLRLRAMMDE